MQPREGTWSQVWVMCPPWSQVWLRLAPLKPQGMVFLPERSILLPDAYREVILGTQNPKMSSMQSLSIHQEGRWSRINTMLPLSYSVGFVLSFKETVPLLSLLFVLPWVHSESVPWRLPKAFGLCLCPHMGLLSQDIMPILPMFLNTCGFLKWGPDSSFGFIMDIPRIQNLSLRMDMGFYPCPCGDSCLYGAFFSSCLSRLAWPVWPLQSALSHGQTLPGTDRRMTRYTAKNLPTLCIDLSLANILIY